MSYFARTKNFGKMAEKGQLVIEYVAMFTVIVLVILYAANNLVRPSMNNFFNKATKIIDNVSNAIDTNYP